MKKSPKKILIFIIVTISILGGLWKLNQPGEMIVHPVRRPVIEAIYGLGKVVSNHHYDAMSGVMSTVSRIFVREGQDVQKGDPLLSNQENLLFRTPINGTVTSVKVREGEILLPQTSAIRVENLQDCYIELSLEQESALRVRKGMETRVSFESIRNKILRGSVRAVFPREDEFLVHIDVETIENGVLPGMTADVVIEVGKNRKALLIPARAVSNGMINVRKAGRWIHHKIEIGYVDGTHVEVLSPELTTQDEIRMEKGD